ncbi:hypothetical protein [Jannaschia sp. W003]|uniref:hypothetical protein n=1 Tax=Jannaschia sp. W003 TaxID=2867012 RepID=UPI0021A36BED|nr:hypothetical protein [Jannaschia sp. W003]UWQ19977.1 hypothetical protein K3554_08070 [Jannaschia sp. W003]
MCLTCKSLGLVCEFRWEKGEARFTPCPDGCEFSDGVDAIMRDEEKEWYPMMLPHHPLPDRPRYLPVAIQQQEVREILSRS